MSLMERSPSRSELTSPFVEFGSIDVQYLPASSVRDLRQIRQNYDADELRELADRIPIDTSEDGVKFQLINPPTVAMFDDEGSLRKYLDDHRRYYGLDLDVHDEVILAHPETWNIRVNGHRRGHAIELKCREMGISLDQVMVASTILRNPSFDEARQKQYVENTSAPIKPAEDAQALLLEYIWRWNEHPSVPNDITTRRQRIKELSEFTGHSTDKVKAALMYVSMPEDIRDFTQKGLSYSNVVALARLRDAYLAARTGDGTPQHSVEASEQRMRDYFETVVLKRLHGTDKGSIGTVIEGKIREVTKTASYITEELFVFDEEAARIEGRKRTRSDIAKAAILALRFAELTEDDLSEIIDIVSPKVAASVAWVEDVLQEETLFSHE